MIVQVVPIVLNDLHAFIFRVKQFKAHRPGTEHDMPQDWNLEAHCCESLRSHKTKPCLSLSALIQHNSCESWYLQLVCTVLCMCNLMAHKSLQLDPTLSKLNPLHPFIPDFSKINFRLQNDKSPKYTK